MGNRKISNIFGDYCITKLSELKFKLTHGNTDQIFQVIQMME